MEHDPSLDGAGARKPPLATLCAVFDYAVACPYRNLYPAILMMKPAEDRPRSELAQPLNRPMARRILVQRQMRSEFCKRFAASTGLPALLEATG
jgi:hypothetical protein